MKTILLKKTLLSAVILFNASYAHMALAHSAGGPIGASAGATDVAAVECFDDGSGPPDHLFIQIEDTSPSVQGLYMSMQAFKDNKMVNTTDTVSGDGNASQAARLFAGGGTYIMSVNKTNVGARLINVTYHCQTAGDVHTGTGDISLYQAQ